MVPPHTTSAEGSPSAIPWAALVGLTGVALVLRLVHLGSGLWLDEIYSLIDAFRMPFSELFTVFTGDTQHPFYSILAHASLRIFGESAWSIRLPAAVLGAATVPALYVLVREVADRRAGLLSAALLTVSYHHVWFSQNARGYSTLAFLAVVATWALIRGLRTGGWGYFIGYAVLVGLGAYTHLTMVFLAFGQAAVVAVLLLRRDEEWRVTWPLAATAFVGAAAVTLVLYGPVLTQVWAYFDAPTTMVGISTRRWALAEAFRMLQVGFGPTLGVALVLTYLGGGCWRLFRQSPVVFGLVVTPGIVTVLGAALARGTMYPRFFFFMAGFVVLILVEGAFWLAGWVARLPIVRWRAETVGTALMVAVIVGSVLSLPYNYRYPKQDFEGGVAYLEAHRAPDEAVRTIGVTELPYQTYLGLDWPGVANRDELDAVRADSSVWLFYAMPRYTVDGFPDVWALIERECDDAARFRGTVGDGDIFACRLAKTANGGGTT